jgi:type I restriction enzyme, S subunit
MNLNWAQTTVAELQARGALLVEDGNHGENRPRPDEFTGDGVQFIRAADMESGRVLFESAQRINEVALRRVRKGIGAGGDVLLSHKGTVGKVAYVPVNSPPFICSPQTTFWRVKDADQLDRRYLYYFLRSRAFHDQLNSRKGETDMADYVSLTNQRTLTVTVPPIIEQKAIAAVLGALDDKIELNRRMNATLEAMARALFQSWFVDFDPVRARLDGRHSTGLDSATVALFPSAFQGSELGRIPHGWRAASLRKSQMSVAEKGPQADAMFSLPGATSHSTEVVDEWATCRRRFTRSQSSLRAESGL